MSETFGNEAAVIENPIPLQEAPDEPSQNQRQWWSERRDFLLQNREFLMKDLYPPHFPPHPHSRRQQRIMAAASALGEQKRRGSYRRDAQPMGDGYPRCGGQTSTSRNATNLPQPRR